MKSLTKVIKESKDEYQVYHKTYTSAVETAKEYLDKRGYDVDEEKFATEFGIMNSRPKNGQTVKVSIQVQSRKKKKPEYYHVQIFDMGNATGNTYELNAYIN